MNVLNTAIYSRLQGGTALTSLLAGTTAIYHIQAPEGQDYPYVVWNTQGGGDTNDTANRLKNLVVYVRAYTAGLNGAAQGGSIDAQMDTLLHLAPLTVSGWTNIWLARETDVELPLENDPSGRPIHTCGGMYRIIIDSN